MSDRIRALEADLAIERGLHETAARDRREAERNAVILCKFCGQQSATLAGVMRHLEEARQGPLGHLHHDDQEAQ